LNLVSSPTSMPQTGSITLRALVLRYLRFISNKLFKLTMNIGNTMQGLTEVEFRVLEILRMNSRLSVSEIAEELGVSRATVSRAIRSLERKGVRFTVDFLEDAPRAFVLTRKPQGGECYRLIDGRYMLILKGNSMDELVKAIDEVEDKEAVFIALPPGGIRLTVKLTCDYCGGPTSKPLIYRRWRRTYYLCCRTCLRELRRKLSNTGRVE
jgi:DNA-binding MarR family transcriptional regulator